MSEFVEVPHQQLSSEALNGLIEEFINREGTDYGEYEHSFADKVAQLQAALASGQAVIVFDPVIESCTLLPRDEFLKLKA